MSWGCSKLHNCPGSQIPKKTHTQGARAGCIHPRPFTIQPRQGLTHKSYLPQKNCFGGTEEKDPAGTAGKHSGNQHTLALATSNGQTQTEKPFLGTWPESKPLRGSGSMKAKDQQQKDIKDHLLNGISWPSNSHGKPIKGAAVSVGWWRCFWQLRQHWQFQGDTVGSLYLGRRRFA